MENAALKRISIPGEGFAGLTVAMELEKKLGRDRRVEVRLVNRENFFLFTPRLHEVAVSDLDLTTIVNPIRKMLQHVQFFAGEVNQIDIEQRRVVVSHDEEKVTTSGGTIRAASHPTIQRAPPQPRHHERCNVFDGHVSDKRNQISMGCS